MLAAYDPQYNADALPANLAEAKSDLNKMGAMINSIDRADAAIRQRAADEGLLEQNMTVEQTAAYLDAQYAAMSARIQALEVEIASLQDTLNNTEDETERADLQAQIDAKRAEQAQDQAVIDGNAARRARVSELSGNLSTLSTTKVALQNATTLLTARQEAETALNDGMQPLQQTLNEQFGVAYTPVSIPETNTFADEALLYAGKLEPGGLLERVKEAKTVILVSPRLELLRRIASGDDGDPLSHLLVRAILWQKDVRVYLDYEPPRFRRNTFLADTAEAIDTLRQMAVTVCPYFAVAPQEPEGTDLVTEADVLDAAKTESKTIRCRSGAIITPAARDALAATDVILRYEGETTHAAS